VRLGWVFAPVGNPATLLAPSTGDDERAMVRPRGRVQRRPELLHVGSGGRGRHGAGGSGCRVFGEGSRSSSPRRPIKKLRIIRVF